MISFLTIIGVGFLLGIRHATDPDHVIAVTTIVSRQQSIRHAGVIGVSGTAPQALKAAGHDHAGVDFGDIERGGDGGNNGKRLHDQSVRTSVRRPVTAAAAAIAGLMIWVSAPGP